MSLECKTQNQKYENYRTKQTSTTIKNDLQILDFELEKLYKVYKYGYEKLKQDYYTVICENLENSKGTHI